MDFLQVLRRFFAIRGYPKCMRSDNGTQLVGAVAELRQMVKGLDAKKLREFSAERGMEWKFITPGAPHQNGCAEALVKSVKIALKRAIGETTLTPFELYTLLLEVANLVNQRPIGRIPNDPDDGAYICPNDMLLGRASPQVPQGPFKETNDPRKRVEFVQRIIDSFWRRWTRDVFPILVSAKEMEHNHPWCSSEWRSDGSGWQCSTWKVDNRTSDEGLSRTRQKSEKCNGHHIRKRI